MNFHFVMTLTHPTSNGSATATFSGTYTPTAGETRADVYIKIFNSVAKQIHADRPNVLFFSLERNELSAA
jgi:hypothetical protein